MTRRRALAYLAFLGGASVATAIGWGWLLYEMNRVMDVLDAIEPGDGRAASRRRRT